MTEQTTKPEGVCTATGCTRPAEEGTSFPGCAEHRRVYDAQASTEAWEFVLGSWAPGSKESSPSALRSSPA